MIKVDVYYTSGEVESYENAIATIKFGSENRTPHCVMVRSTKDAPRMFFVYVPWLYVRKIREYETT